ncbi:MAG: hypothetical protein J6B06_06465 [Lachnospiraceae bacterium]|nr:hypothetical protein [Lachnospiraceae bacterium]
MLYAIGIYKKPDEICGPAAFFERMGVSPVIGNKLTISFRPNGEGVIRTREFIICGIVSQNDVSKLNVSDSRIVYGAEVSEELVKEYLVPEERRVSANIRVSGEEHLTYDGISEKIKAVAADISCDESNIKLNSQYLITVLDLGSETTRTVGTIALLIMVFSGLVIYSIYYVGVITDVQEIGKLKSLGASQKQIKRMLLLEGACIAVKADAHGGQSFSGGSNSLSGEQRQQKA